MLFSLLNSTKFDTSFFCTLLEQAIQHRRYSVQKSDAISMNLYSKRAQNAAEATSRSIIDLIKFLNALREKGYSLFISIYFYEMRISK